MSLLGIITRTFLGLAPAPAPAQQHFVPTAPLVAAPTAQAQPASAADVV